MKLKKIRIGDLIERNKTPIQIEDNIDYKQVTIKTNYKGVKLRGIKSGSKIGTKRQFIVRPGQFILSGIDARHGAFGIIPEELDGAIITNDFWAFDIDENKILLELFYILLRSPIFLEACIKASKGNTNRRRIQKDFFLDYELIIPDLIDDQREMCESVTSGEKSVNLFRDNISNQLTDFKNLRQAILQEAIQGKLVAQAPTDEPATELLARIKAEKERLIKEKEIRKEKPLADIKEEEVPFDLPKGWVWCRLNDITSKLGSGSTPRGGKSAYSKQGIKFLRSQNIYNDGLKLNDVVFIDEEINEKMKGTIVRPNDLLLNITGGSIGRAVRVPKDFDIANVSQHVSIIRPVISELSDYLYFLILSDYFQKSIISSVTGAGREGLPKYKMLMFLIPLPPLNEIPRTIDKVRELLSLISNLEKQTKAQQQDAEILMQGVLAEAFS